MIRFQSIVILTLFLLFQKSDLAKVTIKSLTGDWCIRAKNLETVIVDKCLWTQDERLQKIQEAEQIFDVHPADVDEEERADYERPKPLTSFLIRLSSRPRKSASSATKCLSSISSSLLSIEKCNLLKSRFRLSGRYLTKLKSKPCSSNQNYNGRNEISYAISSSDRLCLQLETTNVSKEPNFHHALTFAICDATRDQNPASSKASQFNRQLWQLCDPMGNCSLSPSDFNWSSMIITEGETEGLGDKLDCDQERKSTTSSPTSTTTTTTTMTTSPRTTTTTSSSTTTSKAPNNIITSTSEIGLLVDPKEEYHNSTIMTSSTEHANSNEIIPILRPMEGGTGSVQPSPIVTFSLCLCLSIISSCNYLYKRNTQ